MPIIARTIASSTHLLKRDIYSVTEAPSSGVVSGQSRWPRPRSKSVSIAQPNTSTRLMQRIEFKSRHPGCFPNVVTCLCTMHSVDCNAIIAVSQRTIKWLYAWSASCLSCALADMNQTGLTLGGHHEAPKVPAIENPRSDALYSKTELWSRGLLSQQGIYVLLKVQLGCYTIRYVTKKQRGDSLQMPLLAATTWYRHHHQLWYSMPHVRRVHDSMLH
jgi:hypothetical protein